jgi:hypothetical protein
MYGAKFEMNDNYAHVFVKKRSWRSFQVYFVLENLPIGLDVWTDVEKTYQSTKEVIVDRDGLKD